MRSASCRSSHVAVAKTAVLGDSRESDDEIGGADVRAEIAIEQLVRESAKCSLAERRDDISRTSVSSGAEVPGRDGATPR